jgi:hypothetical protein
MSDSWESRTDMVDAAHAAGFNLSGPQLGRLHRADLIPGPRTRRLGRGRGTVSEFPPGTTSRLLRILELQKRGPNRKFSTTAWCLWWEDGGVLARPAKELLRETASRWDQQREELFVLLDREDEGDPDAMRSMDKLYKEVEQGRAEGPLGPIRRNVGREGFSSVARVFAEVVTGRFESYPDEEVRADGIPKPGTTGALVEQALGLDHARDDRIAGNEPRFTGSSEAHLLMLARMLGDRPLASLVAVHSDDELEKARCEVRSLLELVSVFATMIERVLGGDTGGYRTIARALDLRTPRSQASMLIAWLALRQDPELVRGLRDLVMHLPKHLQRRSLSVCPLISRERSPASRLRSRRPHVQTYSVMERRARFGAL